VTTATGVPDRPRAMARNFGSAEDYATFNGLAGIRINGPIPRVFTARMAVLDLDGVWVRSGEASVGLSLVGATSDNHTFTFATGPAQPRLMVGREVTHDVLFHPRPNEVFTTRSLANAPFPWGAVTVSFAKLAGAGAGIAGRDVAPSRTDTALLRANPTARARLLRLVQDATVLAATAPEVAEHPASRDALSAAVLDALVDCLSLGMLEHDRAASRRHQQIMSRVEAVLGERPDAGLGMEELCRTAGASRRTLHEVCMNLVGMPPMQYVRLHRLKQVRSVLLDTDPRTGTVTEIAMRFGFWQLARFGAAYRTAFGEAPSETLRRQPE
jgi:AraC-like DNA-binding protein